MRRFIAVVGSLVLVVCVAVPAATATAPQSVSIVSVMNVTPDDDPNWGTFEASGPAVDHRVICARGTVTDTYLEQVEQGWEVGKAFVCDAAHRTLLVRIVVRPNADGTEWFTWSVQGGSGPLRALVGSGRGTTAPLGDQQVTNTYTGTLVDW